MKYLPAYVLVCWLHVIMAVLASVGGEYPYRCSLDDGGDLLRPGTFAEYRSFRSLQDGG